LAGRTPCAQTSKVLRRTLVSLATPMGRTETLQQIKEAEAKALNMRKEAEEERETILREARKKDLELQDALRKEAEEMYNKVMAEARRVISKEREAILERGRLEAKSVKDEGMKNFDIAVAWLAGKFKGAVNA